MAADFAMNEHMLSADTQATLLLCGHFGKEDAATKPLTLTEYNDFSRWLLTEGLRPASLVDADMEWFLETLARSGYDVPRFTRLFARGGALAIAVEQWTNSGIWVMSRGDDDYPERLKNRLKQSAPPILFGCGERELLSRGGLAVVGSRNADETALSFARRVGEGCARDHVQVVSGGARGVDSESMIACLDHGGTAVGVLAENLARETTAQKYRAGFDSGRLALISPFQPRAVFNVGGAMERNKYIYVLSDFALAVSADLGKGGTWSGALENLKQGWVPLFVRDEPGVPDGNPGLRKKGAFAISGRILESSTNLLETLASCATSMPADQPMVVPQITQQSLFSIAAPTETDSFDTNWPSLADRLKVERTEAELAQESGLSPKQIRELLKEAEARGWVKRLKKPVRYIIA